MRNSKSWYEFENNKVHRLRPCQEHHDWVYDQMGLPDEVNTVDTELTDWLLDKGGFSRVNIDDEHKLLYVDGKVTEKMLNALLNHYGIDENEYSYIYHQMDHLKLALL